MAEKTKLYDVELDKEADHEADADDDEDLDEDEHFLDDAADDLDELDLDAGDETTW